MDGWIKLHRKLIENEIYVHDHTAWRVFFHLLILADRKTGQRNIGRFQIAMQLDMKPTTAYAALKRLEKAKMIDIKSNNKFSTISIVNWHSYQGIGNNADDNKMTTNRQQNDTKQEVRIKNKEITKREYLLSPECHNKLIEKFTSVDEKALKEKCEAFYDYCESKDKSYKNYFAAVSGAVRRDKDQLPKRREKYEYQIIDDNLDKLSAIKSGIGLEMKGAFDD